MSYDVLSVKIRPPVSPVGERKNQKSEVNTGRLRETLNGLNTIFWW